MANVTQDDIQELTTAITDLRDAINEIAMNVDREAIQEAIVTGIDQAFHVDTQDVREAIAIGVDKAFAVYSSQVLDAIADGTREALGSER